MAGLRWGMVIVSAVSVTVGMVGCSSQGGASSSGAVGDHGVPPASASAAPSDPVTPSSRGACADNSGWEVGRVLDWLDAGTRDEPIAAKLVEIADGVAVHRVDAPVERPLCVPVRLQVRYFTYRVREGGEPLGWLQQSAFTLTAVGEDHLAYTGAEPLRSVPPAGYVRGDGCTGRITVVYLGDAPPVGHELPDTVVGSLSSDAGTAIIEDKRRVVASGAETAAAPTGC